MKNSAFDLYRHGQLNNLPPDQTADWVFNASVDVVGNIPPEAYLRYSIVDLDTQKEVSSGNLSNIENGGDVITGIATLDASEYELWWPNGLGAQKLYNVSVEIVSSQKNIASVTKRMGFRTIVLNMEPISDLQLSQGIINGSNCKSLSAMVPMRIIYGGSTNLERSSLRNQREHFLCQGQQLCSSRPFLAARHTGTHTRDPL